MLRAAGLRAVYLDLPGLPEMAPRSLDAAEEEAAHLRPVRLVRGPVPERLARHRRATFCQHHPATV